MKCLDDTLLQRLLEGTVPPDQLAHIESHVDECAACRELTADLILARSATGSVAASENVIEHETPHIGRRYILEGVVGRGSMGMVFRATDRLSGQTVALKRVLHGSSAAGYTEALAQEFRTLATLRHPHIVSVLDYGFDAERRPYFTMELLEGARPLLPLAASLPHAVQIELLFQLLHALGYLHRRGILHRDLKPSNIQLIGSDHAPTLKVVDFGLSSAEDDSNRSRAAGTLSYLAPEIFLGAAASTSSDLYAVGLIAYGMFAVSHRFATLRTNA